MPAAPSHSADPLEGWNPDDPATAPLGPLIRALGISVTAAGPDRTALHWGDVTTGSTAGAFAIVAETTCSVGAALWWGKRGRCVGMSNHTTVFDLDAVGPFAATASPVDRGMVQQLWRCEITDASERLVGSAEVLLANLS